MYTYITFKTCNRWQGKSKIPRNLFQPTSIFVDAAAALVLAGSSLPLCHLQENEGQKFLPGFLEVVQIRCFVYTALAQTYFNEK
jgi:hypothetical protein